MEKKKLQLPMRRILVLVALFSTVCHCHAQRYDRTRTYDVIGLPNGEEVWDCICKAFPLVKNTRQKILKIKARGGDAWVLYL